MISSRWLPSFCRAMALCRKKTADLEVFGRKAPQFALSGSLLRHLAQTPATALHPARINAIL
jgi:hypothetical protein